MRRSGIANPPGLPLFLVFVSYGGWLVVLLTELFWYWSGMASLGVAYLVFIAPVVMLILAYRLSSQRHLSLFHHWAFIASAVYIVLPASVFLLRAVLMQILP